MTRSARRPTHPTRTHGVPRRSRSIACRARLLAWGGLIVFAVLSSGCQFLQNEFWVF